MFGGFEEERDEQARKRWFASTGSSLIIFGVIGIGLVVLAKQTVSAAKEEEPIDVTFHATAEPEPESKPPPPPPPPPKANPGPKVKRPGKAAPLQPNVIPETRPTEANPSEKFDATAVAQEEFGDGELGTGPIAPVPPPPPPPPPPAPAREEKIPDPVDEIDPGVTAPRARSENAMPVYPEAARKKGLEAEVILKIKISARGDVIAAEVVRGEEPFASAAKAAVLTWHYEPALVDGKPSTFVKLVKIPFRIRS